MLRYAPGQFFELVGRECLKESIRARNLLELEVARLPGNIRVKLACKFAEG